MKSKSISEDQPDNDTCDHSNPTSLKPLCNTSNGFEKILSCFGLMREKEQPGKNVLAMNGHSQRLNGVVSSEFDVAAAKLLRQNFRKELPLPRQCTRVKHIQQLESWDCGTFITKIQRMICCAISKFVF